MQESDSVESPEGNVEVPRDVWERIRDEAAQVFEQVVGTTAEIAALERRLANRVLKEEIHLRKRIEEFESNAAREEENLEVRIGEEEKKYNLVLQELHQLRSIVGQEVRWRQEQENLLERKISRENKALSQLEVKHKPLRSSRSEEAKGTIGKPVKTREVSDAIFAPSGAKKGVFVAGNDPNLEVNMATIQRREGREAFLRFKERHRIGANGLK